MIVGLVFFADDDDENVGELKGMAGVKVSLRNSFYPILVEVTVGVAAHGE